MALTWYTQSGTPADATGADGDMSFDYTNRIQWGPRGQKTAGSWTGTAVNAVGPTGPGVLSGTGAPASSLGQTGNMYVDATQGNTYTKGASSWSLVGALPPGPTGAAGPSMLTSQSAGCGYDFACTVTTTTTPVLATIPGTTQTRSFSPTYGTALMGLSYTNPGAAVTATLYDQTVSASVYSVSLTGNATSAVGQFAVNAYPMAANHTYVWQITSSASQTSSVWVQPIYLFPAVSPSYNVSSIGTATSGASKTFTTGQNLLNAGGTSIGQGLKFAKAVSLYAVTVINTTASSLTVNLYLNGGNPIYTVTSPANSTTAFGPYALGTYALSSSSSYYWSVSGTGTGVCILDAQISTSVA